MSQSFIYDTELRLTSEGAQNGTRAISENTVLVVVRGMSLAKEFRIAITRRPMTFNQDVKALQCAEDIDPQFLFYALKARKEYIRDLATEASHGTKKLETSTLNAVEILAPETIEEQQAIAEVALNYDELIENNRRRITLLEESARQLYKEWFVRFRFPGHEHVKTVDGVPEGWARLNLGSICDLKWGDTNTTKDSYVDTGFDAYSAKGLDGKLDHFDFDRDGIVISAIGAQCGKTWIARGNWSCIKNTMRMFPTDQRISVEYLFYATERGDFWQRRGGAQPFISQGDARGLAIVVPPTLLAKQFEDIANSNLRMAKILADQNVHLAKARDLLLPKLMSGAIAV
tara:strand:- start:9514 stop:10545 length:1032 start_codon:yes stop_codon:yes gene_type:complete